MKVKKERTKSDFIGNGPSYRFDHRGNIVSGLESPEIYSFRYRDLKSRIGESSKERVRSPSLNKNSVRDNHFKLKLSLNINTRQVYVLKDGTSVNLRDKLPGFYYSFQLTHRIHRDTHGLEMDNFFKYCQQQFKATKSFKFLFNSSGKVLHCLHEVPIESKIVVVGHSLEFQGIHEQNYIEVFDSDSNCYKTCITEKNKDLSFIQNIENRFIIKSSKCSANNSKQTNTELRNKFRIRRRFRTPENKFIEHQQLKEDLGCASYKIDKTFKTVFSQGIGDLKQKFKFSEAELYNLYGKYKLLVLLSCGLDPDHDIRKGVTKQTFIEFYSKSKEISFVLGRIFDKFDSDGGGTVSWEEYLQAMNIIWHGDCNSQLELFFGVYDLDNSGKLSFQEIQELCKLQLQIENDGIVDELSYSFATLIFDLTKTKYDQEIPLAKLKEVIQSQNDKGLIEMFCSFNCLKMN